MINDVCLGCIWFGHGLPVSFFSSFWRDVSCNFWKASKLSLIEATNIVDGCECVCYWGVVDKSIEIDDEERLGGYVVLLKQFYYYNLHQYKMANFTHQKWWDI